jgi:uncharacterized membrane protein
MGEELEEWLSRWIDAGILDTAAAARIREFESSHTPSGKLRCPVIVALAFGAIMLAAGVLLFVASHWDDLSPAGRFSLVLLMVAIFHVGGAFAQDRFDGLAMALHGLGTAALGAGIYLSGQIFNMSEHWPTGILLWAIGAWTGWFLCRDWVQLLFVAVLTPAWVAGEWAERTLSHRIGYNEEGSAYLLVFGLTLLSATYFSAITPTRESLSRRLLTIVGGVSILPMVIAAAAFPAKRLNEVQGAVMGMGIFLFLILPLGLAAWLRGQQAWKNGVAAAWLVILALLNKGGSIVAIEAWCAVAGIGMVAWGVDESRPERINMGMAGFALSIAFFYFSNVMDKLGRSLSLMILGILFLLGGWALEKTRRRLIAGLAGGAQ